MAKARKWSNFADTIPPPVAGVSERELKVREATDDRADKPMQELALEYQELVEEEEFEDLAKKARSIKYEALERRIRQELKKLDEYAGTDMWRGAGQTFSPQNMIIPVVTDRAALRQYLEDTKQQHLLTLDGSRLKSLVTDVLESFETMTPAERAACTFTPEQPLPGVKIYLKPGIHRTGGK